MEVSLLDEGLTPDIGECLPLMGEHSGSTLVDRWATKEGKGRQPLERGG